MSIQAQVSAPRSFRVPALRATAVLCIVAAAWWAFTPLGFPSVDLPERRAVPTPRAEPTRIALDVSAFRAPLWVAPPPPPAREKPPPKPALPAPLNLQLLAIVREGTAYKAVLYDPDGDKVVVAAEGQSLAGGRTFKLVDERHVEIAESNGVVRALALRQDIKTSGTGSEP